MRTASAPTANKITLKTPATPKRSAPASDEKSSFDQILQKRTTPKREEPKTSDATAPNKAERVTKRPTTKARSNKDAEAVDLNQSGATVSNKGEQPNVEPTDNAQPETTEDQSSDATVEAVKGDQQPSDGSQPSEQIVNVGVAVGVPADVTTGDVTTSDATTSDATVEQSTKPADSAVSTATPVDPNAAPVSKAPVELKETQPAVDETPVGTNAAPDTQFQLPETDEPQVADNQVAPSPQTVESTAKKPAATEKTPIDGELAKADPLGAKPVDQAPTNSGNNNASDSGQRAANMQLQTDGTEDASFSGDTPAAFRVDEAVPAEAKRASSSVIDPDASLLSAMKPAPAPRAQPIAAPPPVRSPEATFATENHANIVTSVRTNLLPNGGTMQIRLNPPELGEIQVAVQMRDGVMNASFETTSDQATRMLSHSLGELRTSLENSGVAVDKLHVEQAPRSQQPQNQANDDRQQQGQAQDSPGRREQERRELLQRMWRKLSEGSDPLDMVA